MKAFGNVKFEVQVYSRDHWVADDRFATEAEAVERARKLIQAPSCEGVRVVRERLAGGGGFTETEIFKEMQRKSKPLTIQPIDEAPPCQTPEDLLGPRSRMTMNRLLRGYVEQMVVTPTEIMHDYRELRRLMDKDNLLATAVSRIAQLQAGAAGEAPGTPPKAAPPGGAVRERRDALFGMVNEVLARAKRASEIKNLPDVGEVGLGETMARLRDTVPDDDFTYCSLALLSRHLVHQRAWMSKLDSVMTLVRREEDGNPEARGLLDGVAADVVGAPGVVRDLLGDQPSMAAALANLIELSRGGFGGGAMVAADSPVWTLNAEIANQGLNATVTVLIDLVCRQFKSNQPLARADDNGAEAAAFDELIARVVSPDGIYGGGAMAEALVCRQGRYVEAGGATGRKQAINDVLGHFSDPKDRVRFLMTLADSDLGRQQVADVYQHLGHLTDGSAASELFIKGAPIRSNLADVTRLFRQVQGSHLDTSRRDHIADRVDETIADYIVRNRVIERLDNPNDPLRHRAIRLMQLCSPDVLCSPKTLAIARERIVGLLRQPNFQEKFCDGLPPDEAEAKIREFYRLLMQAGFR